MKNRNQTFHQLATFAKGALLRIRSCVWNDRDVLGMASAVGGLVGMVALVVLFAQSGLAGPGGSLPPLDDRVVATLTILDGYNVDDSCRYYSQTGRITIYADGRVMEQSSVRRIVCQPDGDFAEGGHTGLAVTSRLRPRELQPLLVRLRVAKDEAARRMAREPHSGREEEAQRNLTQHFLIAVSADDLGQHFGQGLPSVLDSSEGSALVGRQLRSEIRAIF